mmetsp:Transcript_27560/g.72851  ORF Transcript_27560/g.72851 Transcript_27560/m.72851 type:complete len:275 (-) Transcript_27560:30-854(-)
MVGAVGVRAAADARVEDRVVEEGVAVIVEVAVPRLARLDLPQRLAVGAHRVVHAHFQIEDVAGRVAVAAAAWRVRVAPGQREVPARLRERLGRRREDDAVAALPRQRALGGAHLPLEVPAHAVRALPEEAQDVHVGLDARLRVVCIRAVAVPVDVAVPAEQRRRRLGEVGRNPVLVGAAVPLAELPRRARVPVAVASPPPPRVIEERPAVALPACRIVPPRLSFLPAIGAPKLVELTLTILEEEGAVRVVEGSGGHGDGRCEKEERERCEHEVF